MSATRNGRITRSSRNTATVAEHVAPIAPKGNGVLCPVCFTEISRAHDLKRHMMIHTGQKPYQCEICPKAFTQRSGLNTHMNTHTGEKPFFCGLDNCRKRFGDPSSRNRHQREKHDGIRYVCPVATCDRLEKRPANFEKHINTKHGIDPKSIEPNDYKIRLSEDGTEVSEGLKNTNPSFVLTSDYDEPYLPKDEYTPQPSGPVRSTRRRAAARDDKPYTRSTRSRPSVDNSCIDPQLLAPEDWPFASTSQSTDMSPMSMSASLSPSSHDGSISPAPPDISLPPFSALPGPAYMMPYHYQQQQQQQFPQYQLPRSIASAVPQQQLVGMISNHSRNPYGQFNMNAAASGSSMNMNTNYGRNWMG